MRLACLRAHGADEALDRIRDALDLKIDVRWKAGDRARRNRIHEHSGFNAAIVDAANLEDLYTETIQFLTACQEKGINFRDLNVEAEIDIGISVGCSEQLMPSLSWEPEDLKLFSDLGVRLTVSGYPASDEEEEE